MIFTFSPLHLSSPAQFKNSEPFLWKLLKEKSKRWNVLKCWQRLRAQRSGGKICVDVDVKG